MYAVNVVCRRRKHSPLESRRCQEGLVASFLEQQTVAACEPLSCCLPGRPCSFPASSVLDYICTTNYAFRLDKPLYYTIIPQIQTIPSQSVCPPI
jgi:hypothetical protein